MAGGVVDVGVEAAEELLAFAEAAVRGEPLDEVRRDLSEVIGADGVGQAAETIAAFSGLVRVADGIGIPIDEGLAAASVEIRDELGLNEFHGAANTDLAGVEAGEFEDVESLW